MKRLNLFLLGLTVMGMAFFTSCTEETNAPPEITIDQASPVTAVNGAVVLTGEIVAEAKLDEVKLFIVTANAETQYGSAYTSFKSGDITTSDDLTYIFRFDVTGITESCAVKIQATDKDNQTSSKSVDVEVSAAGGPIESYTNITLGSWGEATGSSFASVDGSVMTKAMVEANSTKADFLYFYGSTNKATIASLTDSDAQSVYSWLSSLTRNDTKLGTTAITANEFDAMTDDTEIVTATAGLTASKVNNLAVGNVFAFKTASTSSHPNKCGLAKVTAITGGNASTGAGTITLAVKVQE